MTPASETQVKTRDELKELRSFAGAAKRTACTGDNDARVLDAVKRGYLSVSNAMNSDD